MEYTSEFDRVTGICTVRVTGLYRRPEDSDELKRFAVGFSSKTGCRLFLVDLTDTEVVGGTMPTFKAASPQGALGQALRDLKAAFVRRELTPQDRFFEDVAVNRGFRLRAFEKLDEAAKWLIQGE